MIGYSENNRQKYWFKGRKLPFKQKNHFESVMEIMVHYKHHTTIKRDLFKKFFQKNLQNGTIFIISWKNLTLTPLTNCMVVLFASTILILAGPYSVEVSQQLKVTSLITPKYIMPFLSIASAALCELRFPLNTCNYVFEKSNQIS